MAGLFSNWFKKKANRDEKKFENIDLFLLEIKEYDQFCKDIFNSNGYISKSACYKQLLFEDIYDRVLFFLSSNQHFIEQPQRLFLENFAKNYADFDNRVAVFNDFYVQRKLAEEKHYLDEILHSIDKNIMLDEEQRIAVLKDEDYTLIIAGAGAGKTTTVAAKVKYLVDKKNIKPNEILVISYTNKAVDELKERIQKNLNIPAIITTFHSTGYAVLKKDDSRQNQRVYPPEALFAISRRYLLEQVFTEPDTIRQLIQFFGYYIDVPFDGNDIEKFFDFMQRSNFESIRSNLNDYSKDVIDLRTKSKKTIKSEFLRSQEEVQIANFLYLNSVEYEYEKPYPFRLKQSNKIYTPDFYVRQGDKIVYIEHFGITEDGKHSRYSKEELDRYKQAIEDKKLLHQNKGTSLITTYSKYLDNRTLLDHLKDQLILHGFDLVNRSDIEVYEKLRSTEENKYINRFVLLITRFISNFKVKGYNAASFLELRQKTTNVRTRLFLNICEKVYLHYQNILKEKHAIDFDDMINESASLLKSYKKESKLLHFKYIIVDEYQDISRQRFDLTKALSQATGAKVIAVGDDWQSIYAFAGSEVSLFTRFKESMGYADLLHITHTYRNSQELIDIAGDFVQKNNTQIKKTLKSNKSIQKPVVIFSYSDDTYKNEKKGKSGVIYEKAIIIDSIIQKIVQVHGENTSILLIGRFGFDAERLSISELFTYENEMLKSTNYPSVKITALTAHSSKGLGFDNVIIINATNDTYGFPSKIETDPILKLVIEDDKAIDFAEERRLFYVALTRTKNRVFIAAPMIHPSEFVVELVNNYPNITVHGEISKSVHSKTKNRTKCPVCGYPMILQHKEAYGLKLYMCTNDEEVCGYITNDMISGKQGIHMCPECTSGVMIVKKQKNKQHFFFGCSNYDVKGIECKHTETIEANDRLDTII